MNLKLIRKEFTEDSTIGELYVNGTFECYTLEDKVRESKVYARTAIPTGTYKITITYSPRFKRYLPLLHDVPNFSGVRIHTGNHADNTEGCLLVGTAKGKDWISNSKVAFNKLYPQLVHASQNGETIEIEIC